MRLPNYMDEFLATTAHSTENWYQTNLPLFLSVCELHGKTAIQHHDQLVKNYIVTPSSTLARHHLEKLTASGPPIDVLVASLEKLRDRRAAADRPDLRTRYADIKLLRSTLSPGEKT